MCSGNIDIIRAWLYPLAAVILALMIYLSVAKRTFWRLLFIESMVIGGFSGFLWTHRTGNIQILSAVLLTSALTLICKYRAKYNTEAFLYIAAIFLGSYAALKFIELPILGTLLLLPTKNRAKIFFCSLGTFCSYYVISYIFYLDYIPTYIGVLRGTIPHQHSPATEGGNPSIYFAIKYLSEYLSNRNGIVNTTKFISYFIFIYLLYIATLYSVSSRLPEISRKPPLEQAKLLFRNTKSNKNVSNVAILLFSLLWILVQPRLKEYNFLDAAILIGFLVINFPGEKLLFIATLSIITPLLILFSENQMGFLFYGFSQTTSLAICFLYIIRMIQTHYHEKNTHRPTLGYRRCRYDNSTGGSTSSDTLTEHSH